MISSPRSEALWRLGAACLFLALMAASALSIHGITPVTGAADTPASISAPVDRGAALLTNAARPFEQVTFCEPQKAYAPDRVQLGMGAATVDTAPYRPVIICSAHALDYDKAVARATRDRLAWTRHIIGTDLIAFAADQGGFEGAMHQAGLSIPASQLLPVTPQLGQMHSNVAGAALDMDGWRLPASSDERLQLFGPYLSLSAGDYAVRWQGRFQGGPAECSAAVRALRPSLSVTADAGKATLAGRSAATVAASPTDPCAFTVASHFTVGSAGAQDVETPLYAALAKPVVVDAYVLEPVAAAQSR